MRTVVAVSNTASSRLGSLAIKTVAFIGLGMAAAWSGSRSASVSAGQAGAWSVVLNRPSGGKYNDFAFPDPKHGWLVSATGDILHSSDGGVTWALQASQKGSLRSVDFLDERRGFAGTLSGVLYATTDGGANWTDITKSLPRPGRGFCGMTHVGEHVHMVGRYFGSVTDYFFSPDGGRTWRASDLRDLAQGLVDVSFLNESVGLIGGMSSTGPVNGGPAVILKTTDGGRQWRTVFTHDGGRGFVWKIFPVTAKLIYAALQSQDGIYRVAKSTDAGDTWSVQTVATGRPQGPAVQGIGFLDERTGWVGGFFEGMYGTTDGGLTWTPVPTPSGRMINRFEKVGGALFTAGSRGILRYDATR
jgi:photosystem II stability/assembly factor-like uncharacterized protein